MRSAFSDMRGTCVGVSSVRSASSCAARSPASDVQTPSDGSVEHGSGNCSFESSSSPHREPAVYASRAPSWSSAVLRTSRWTGLPSSRMFTGTGYAADYRHASVLDVGAHRATSARSRSRREPRQSARTSRRRELPRSRASGVEGSPHVGRRDTQRLAANAARGRCFSTAHPGRTRWSARRDPPGRRRSRSSHSPTRSKSCCSSSLASL